ncbi:MAG: WYL domain-containing protein [Spirochaetales bacterium]|nr:WYL domain-containing protein [Spirochaetales bacterium]
MSQTERIYYMLRTLSKNDRLTVKEVSQKYEVSTRQVGRDIEYLRNRMNMEVEYDKATKSYVLQNNEELEDFSEYRFLIMESLVDSLLGRLPLSSSMNSNIKSILAEPISLETRSVLDKIVYHAPKIDLPSYAIFSTIVDALVKGQLLSMHYINRNQEPSVRTIEPLKLINYDSVWYLVAFDYKSSELRTFHLSRIQETVIKTEKGNFADNDLLTSYLDSGFGIFLSGNLEPYVMRFKNNAAFQVRTEIWHEKQKLKLLPNNEVELSVPAKQPYELVGRLLTFAGDGYPISPPCFVKLFKESIKKLETFVK